MQIVVVFICFQLWIASTAVAYVYDVTTEGDHSWESFYGTQCGSVTCSPITQDCVNEICECKPGFEHKDDGFCHTCPGEGQVCTRCCHGETSCYGGRCQRCTKDKNGECIQQDTLFFLTAAQVALATAMVIGVSALVTLMYKTFRSRSRNNRQRILESELQRSGSSRLSLSSIQIRVLRRLRDRPPKYETRHNYEFHQREQTETVGETRPSTTPVSDPTRMDPVIGAPPPAYDGDVTSLVGFPPPYSADPPHPNARIAIIDELRSEDSARESSANTGQSGIVNEAFENTEGSDRKIEQSAEIDLVNSNGEHKTIHI